MYVPVYLLILFPTPKVFIENLSYRVLSAVLGPAGYSNINKAQVIKDLK